MNPGFIDFTTSDGLKLPGLLYRAKGSKKVIINLHGNGSSSVFYSKSKNEELAKVFNAYKISILFFNNRGAHIIKSLKVCRHSQVERKMYGMAYEKIKECIEDIDGAIKFVRKLGFREIYLMGASTGANKICIYNYYKPKNLVAKNILLCGGDDVGIYYDMLGKNLFTKIFKKSKEQIEKKLGYKISPELLDQGLVFSYNSFLDIANPDGDYNVFPFYEVINKVKLSKKPLFRHFKSIKKPTLVVYGDKDEFVWGSASRVIEILKSQRKDFMYKIIRGADHGFYGRQKQLAMAVVGWLTNN